MILTFKVKLNNLPIKVIPRIPNKVAQIQRQEIGALAKLFRAESPVGFSRDLKRGWETQEIVRGASISRTMLLTNNSDKAELRIRGRGPGKPPPYGKGTDLGKWAAFKRIKKPFLLARKIGEEGTERWKEGTNFAGIARDGTVQPGSPIVEAEKRIVERLKTEFVFKK